MFLKMLCGFVIMVVFSGCGPDSPQKIAWDEEVLLSDGRTIQVHRMEEYKVLSEIGGPTTAIPIALSIESRDPRLSFSPWSAPYEPILLDIDPGSGDVVIVATSGDCEIWKRGGRPVPPYWVFKFRNGAWTEVKLSDDLIGRKANLLLQIFSADKQKISLMEKSKSNSNPKLFRRLKSVATNLPRACRY